MKHFTVVKQSGPFDPSQLPSAVQAIVKMSKLFNRPELALTHWALLYCILESPRKRKTSKSRSWLCKWKRRAQKPQNILWLNETFFYSKRIFLCVLSALRVWWWYMKLNVKCTAQRAYKMHLMMKWVFIATLSPKNVKLGVEPIKFLLWDETQICVAFWLTIRERKLKNFVIIFLRRMMKN